MSIFLIEGLLFFHLYSIVVCVSQTSGQTNDACIRSCPELKPDMLNVHIICHTHDDLGWLKTVDEYYIGAKQRDQRAGVQYIIDSVIENLLQDPSRKFIYVETGFFWMWWNEQNDDIKEIVKELVKQGRLEFIGGGWSMNDEGATHYTAIIDQLTWGFRRLKDIFGDCATPRIGWQIDPFGHSREQASIFAQMGFDGLFIGRVDVADKYARENTKKLEFLWKPSPNLGKAADIFTGILYNLYQPPPGFCFDILCNDEPIQDNPNLHGYNVNGRVRDFMAFIYEESTKYATDNIMITMGNDFFYQQAGMWYKNLDKLIKYVNAKQVNGSAINVVYSTPSCYLEALHKTNKTWAVKTGDFFPYGSTYYKYWTGYYTSRPTQKGLIRKANNLLQVCKQLAAFAGLESEEHVTVLREIMGVLQHHDAVTGTSRQRVANDYMQRLSEGIEAAQKALNDAYKKLMTKSNRNPPRQEYCPYLNISVCSLTETREKFTVTVYNPLAHSRVHPIRFPVDDSTSYISYDSYGNVIPSQLIPNHKELIEHYDAADYDLLFFSDLPPLGYKTYFIRQVSENTAKTEKESGKSQNSQIILPSDERIIIANKFVKVEIDCETGLLQSVTNLKEQLLLPVRQRFLYYPTTRSGVYVMRTNGYKAVHIGVRATVRIIKGDLVQEIHQTFGSWASQVIRLYNDSKEIEFEWMIGPIPEDDGREVITRFETNLKSNGIFYTDSNGREMVKRVRNHRDTWKVNWRYEPISVNYYPVNSRIFLHDVKENVQMTLLTDRSQGGSSIQDGNLELLIHRRINTLDGGGTGEGVSERGEHGDGLIVRGKIQLLVDRITDAGKHHREVAQQIFMSPWITFAEHQMEPSQWNERFRAEFSGMSTSLPPNVHLLTLEQWKDQTILIRLEHFYEKNEDAGNMSEPATVDLKALFLSFEIVSISEMSLGGNRLQSTVNRLQWETNDNFEDDSMSPSSTAEDDPFLIHLYPMQIRTFILTIERSETSSQ